VTGTHATVRDRIEIDAAGPVAIAPERRETWGRVAEAYATYTSPLRPCREDIALVERAARDWERAHPDVPMRALLLGATPDVATAAWPSGSTRAAVDSSLAVIKAIWPGDVRGSRWVVCGNWVSMPRQQRSSEFVVGDGSLIAFRYPDGFRAAAAAIHDVLTDDGILVLRCYVRPDHCEDKEDVIRDLLGPGIRDINHFKFRLFLATQTSTEAGAPVREMYEFLRSRVSEDTLRSMPGWSRAAVDGFEMWKNADTVYTFPTLTELRDVLGQFFWERAIWYPTYPLGDCCPTLVLTRR
jgi:hypothetical protein